MGAGHILESALELLRAENLEVLYPETIAAELIALRQATRLAKGGVDPASGRV